jgi:hypothetical protein|tara:strand:+ start:68 stop:760 length:693 start_codon:yes stop_codon:yes gene_type:complete
MHTAGKIFLGLGVLMLIGGGIMAGMGGNALEDGVEGLDDLANFAIEDSASGTLNVDDKDGEGDLGFTFWIKGDYLDEDGDGRWDHCATTDITILSHPEVSDDWGDEARELNGSFYYEIRDWFDGCEADEENTDYDRADPEGLIKVGRACLACYAGPMEFESNTEVWVTYDDEIIEELFGAGGELAGGLMGLLGGIGLFGCGICSLILGGVLALVLKDPKEATQIQQPPTV